MSFIEQPKLFIVRYYDDKKNEIDLQCERLISETKDKEEIQSLNELRVELVEKLESAKQTVFQRYDALESKCAEKMPWKNSAKQIQDEVFLDQYCLVLDSYKVFRLFDLKLGLLLFSEFDDHVLEDLKWTFLNFYFNFNKNFKIFFLLKGKDIHWDNL